MTPSEIAVIYKWTAKPGNSEALLDIYKAVTAQMKANEPDAARVACYFDDSSGQLIVHDLFSNADALGFHLSVTAAAHFPQLLEIAIPGSFLFCGTVPDALKQAVLGMGLQATFAPRVFGFDRRL